MARLKAARPKPTKAAQERRASPSERGSARRDASARSARRDASARSPLRDIIVERPRVLLVGINPGLRSGATGHHFAGHGNPFWRLIHASRLVPVLLTPEQDERLAEFGIALTNICPRVTRTAAELTPAELAAGRRALALKIEKMRPRVVAFVGLSVYQVFFGLKKSGGAGPKPERIAGARVFVVPNPSGLNASFPGFADKLVWYEGLRAYVTRKPRGAPGAARLS